MKTTHLCSNCISDGFRAEPRYNYLVKCYYLLRNAEAEIWIAWDDVIDHFTTVCAAVNVRPPSDDKNDEPGTLAGGTCRKRGLCQPSESFNKRINLFAHIVLLHASDFCVWLISTSLPRRPSQKKIALL